MNAQQEPVVSARRAELGDFLRRRRAELSTEAVGLPSTRRRRTPGLRREEVAELANISTALYAWLEQGRDVPVSRRTLEAIGGALQLTSSEREHISMLITHEPAKFDEEISPTLERMVGSLRTQPAFVLDHKWDIVLTNLAAQVTFNYDGEDVQHMNLLRAVFENGRPLFVNWLEVAQNTIELFRYDYALYADDPGSLALVEDLRRSDPDFAQLWERHRVRRSPTPIRQINHPVAGVLSIEAAMFAVVESPGLRIIVYTPADAASERHIAGLVAKDWSSLNTARAGAAVRLR